MTLDSPASAYDASPCGLVTIDADGRITLANEIFREWTGLNAQELTDTAFPSFLDSGSRIFFETRLMPTIELNATARAVSLTFESRGGVQTPTLVNADRDVDGTVRFAIIGIQQRADYERELLVAHRAAEASERRARVLQTASRDFSASNDEHDLVHALADSARFAFDATTTAVFIVDDAGELALVAGTDPLGGAPGPQGVARDTGDVVAITTASDPRMIGARVSSVCAVPLVAGDDILGVLMAYFSRERTIDEAHIELQLTLAQQASEVLVRLRLQQQLAHLAMYDSLTGLANRSVFNARLDTALAADAGLLTVFFLDLDGFKSVNDLHGHAVGDAVLREASERMRSAFRATDMVSRFGGDEFVVLCEGLRAADGEARAEQLCSDMGAVFAAAPSAKVTASIGVAIVDVSTRDRTFASELLSIADNAMYDAKALGKNRTVIRVV